MRNCGKRNVRKNKEFKKGDERVTDKNKYEILEISEKKWHSGYDGNQIIRVKGKIGKIRKGVGNSSDSQDQRKVHKLQIGKGMTSGMSARRTSSTKSPSLKNLLRYLMPKRNPNMNQLQATFT